MLSTSAARLVGLQGRRQVQRGVQHWVKEPTKRRLVEQRLSLASFPGRVLPLIGKRRNPTQECLGCAAATSYRVVVSPRRSYQHMAGHQEEKPTETKEEKRQDSPAKTPIIVEEKRPGDDPLRLNTISEITLKEQRETDWTIIKKLLGHIWPKGDRGTKIRVLLALGLLIGGKVTFLKKHEL